MTNEQIIELGQITTHDSSGRHFTNFSEHWELFENENLIKVHRPYHESSGLNYDQSYWSMEVTPEGHLVVDENEELFED